VFSDSASALLCFFQTLKIHLGSEGRKLCLLCIVAVHKEGEPTRGGLKGMSDDSLFSQSAPRVVSRGETLVSGVFKAALDVW